MPTDKGNVTAAEERDAQAARTAYCKTNSGDCPVPPCNGIKTRCQANHSFKTWGLPAGHPALTGDSKVEQSKRQPVIDQSRRQSGVDQSRRQSGVEQSRRQSSIAEEDSDNSDNSDGNSGKKGWFSNWGASKAPKAPPAERQPLQEDSSSGVMPGLASDSGSIVSSAWGIGTSLAARGVNILANTVKGAKHMVGIQTEIKEVDKNYAEYLSRMLALKEQRRTLIDKFNSDVNRPFFISRSDFTYESADKGKFGTSAHELSVTAGELIDFINNDIFFNATNTNKYAIIEHDNQVADNTLKAVLAGAATGAFYYGAKKLSDMGIDYGNYALAPAAAAAATSVYQSGKMYLGSAAENYRTSNECFDDGRWRKHNREGLCYRLLTENGYKTKYPTPTAISNLNVDLESYKNNKIKYEAQADVLITKARNESNKLNQLNADQMELQSRQNKLIAEMETKKEGIDDLKRLYDRLIDQLKNELVERVILISDQNKDFKGYDVYMQLAGRNDPPTGQLLNVEIETRNNKIKDDIDESEEKINTAFEEFIRIYNDYVEDAGRETDKARLSGIKTDFLKQKELTSFRDFKKDLEERVRLYNKDKYVFKTIISEANAQQRSIEREEKRKIEQEERDDKARDEAEREAERERERKEREEERERERKERDEERKRNEEERRRDEEERKERLKREDEERVKREQKLQEERDKKQKELQQQIDEEIAKKRREEEEEEKAARQAAASGAAASGASGGRYRKNRNTRNTRKTRNTRNSRNTRRNTRNSRNTRR